MADNPLPTNSIPPPIVQGAPPVVGAPQPQPSNGNAPPVALPPSGSARQYVASETDASIVTPMVEGAAGPPLSLEDIHVDELLNIVVDRGCSDLHIANNSEPIIREDGTLFRLNFEKFYAQNIQRMMYDIISDENINKFETTYELDFSYQLPHRARFRVNLFRDRGSCAAAFRLIPQKIPTVQDLNLPPILNNLTEKPRGLILVTGPTGSGKSTSLAAMVNYINMNRAVHIITIEDPIEYLHTHKISLINQREVGSDTREFSNALRACLREDPDVILVGEMRDMETIALAITAAETGHLVFATLHTNNAAESVDRMIDVFPPGQQEQIRTQLSNNIQAIISQQLLPKATGTGRVPANEIMIASSAIRNLIREAKSHQITSMIQTSAKMGMITMDQALRDLYLRGQITMDTAFDRCQHPDELRKMISTIQSPGTVGAPGGNANIGRPQGRPNT